MSATPVCSGIVDRDLGAGVARRDRSGWKTQKPAAADAEDGEQGERGQDRRPPPAPRAPQGPAPRAG